MCVVFLLKGSGGKLLKDTVQQPILKAGWTSIEEQRDIEGKCLHPLIIAELPCKSLQQTKIKRSTAASSVSLVIHKLHVDHICSVRKSTKLNALGMNYCRGKNNNTY